uniref:Large ribosomal subunit protein eL24 n=1 Tax=Amphilophus citrinellus TaxID=61819 RepID=A0A3Q0T420_AMPCI
MKLCSFSGYKIYPGHGRRYARIDGKVFQFLNAKCESAFLAKRNPRQINWTVLYRRKHKKGQSVSQEGKAGSQEARRPTCKGKTLSSES